MFLRHFDGRCAGLGVLTAAAIVAVGLVYGASLGGLALVAVAAGCIAALAASAVGFPEWRDPSRSTWAAGAILAAVGLVAVAVAALFRDTL